MERENKLLNSVISCVLVIALIACAPIEALAQSSINRGNVLESHTQMVLRINENFKADNTTESGSIASIVENDVYSADGTKVLIKAGTPAFIEFTTEPNGSCGKAGKICLTGAYTKTIDNKRVSLRLGSCKNGGSKLGGVIALSVIFFPIGLISLCMKGSMPEIPQGATFNAAVMQDIVVE